MSSSLGHLGVCFILIALLKVSQSFSIGFPAEIMDSELPEEDIFDEQLYTAKREYWPSRQTRFAAPRGKRGPLIDVQVKKLLGLFINPLKVSDYYEQRQTRFAAPRGKRDPNDLMTDDDLPYIEYSPYLSNLLAQRQTRSRFGAPRGKRLREMNWDANFYFKLPRPAKRSLTDSLSLQKRVVPSESYMIRIGRRSEQYKDVLAALGLSEEEIAFLLQNKDQLLRLLTLIEEGKDIGKEGYFAFPRQGRAMSFYFPRMGRTGENTQTVNVPDDSTCCSEGVRSVYTASKGVFEICPADQICCAGLEERTKLYQDLVITDCAPFEESKLTKLRELMTEK